MTRLAFSILLIVLMTHQGYKVAAEFIGTQAGWFYVGRGLAGLYLFLMVASIVLPEHADAAPWLAWGAMEEGMTAICRLAVGMGNPPAPRSQCDAITGLPIDNLTLCVVLFILLRRYGR